MGHKQPAVLNFHQLRIQCETPNVDAWRTFSNWYSPMFVYLLAIYTGGDNSIWEETLELLARDNFERLRSMSRRSEREFLVEVRALMFERVQARAEGNTEAGLLPSDPTGPALDLERLNKIIEGLPLLHQEILWFKLAGYTDATIERMLRVSPTVAKGALERLSPDFDAARELARDRCLWPQSWPNLLMQAHAVKKEDCPPLHQLLRIQDGQVSWYDKEPVEKRVAVCPHCLESWTALREMGYWRRAAPAVPPELIERFTRQIPTTETRKKSLWQRVFGRDRAQV